MAYNIPSIETLIDKFTSLPSIGRKSASRIAFHLLSLSEQQVQDFADAMVNAKKSVKYCKKCQTLTDTELCSICSDSGRNTAQICVVESPQDVMAFERTREYNGTYHVLHGLLSPIDGITPENLKIKELLYRVTNEDVEEVIMATNPTVDGEATAMYISKLLKPFEIKVTRLAYGIPVGASLEYSDEVTLLRAFEGRSELD
ncbi:MAG: recombination mediator RecR [Acutalibacteraceae bacterium]|nr:recombination mediator RecR [Acutalibacteraceae bacterium]